MESFSGKLSKSLHGSKKNSPFISKPVKPFAGAAHDTLSNIINGQNRYKSLNADK